MAVSKPVSVTIQADNTLPVRQAQPGAAIALKRVSGKSLLSIEAPMLTLLLSVLAMSVLVTPDSLARFTTVDAGDTSLVTCPLLALVDIPCLFCGMTRSFTAMGSLDVGQAVTFHPLGPALYVLVILAAAGLAGSLVSGKRLVLNMSPSIWISAVLSTAALVALAWPLKLYLWLEAGLI